MDVMPNVHRVDPAPRIPAALGEEAGEVRVILARRLEHDFEVAEAVPGGDGGNVFGGGRVEGATREPEAKAGGWKQGSIRVQRAILISASGACSAGALRAIATGGRVATCRPPMVPSRPASGGDDVR
jgi:hypothetical protein